MLIGINGGYFPAICRVCFRIIWIEFLEKWVKMFIFGKLFKVVSRVFFSEFLRVSYRNKRYKDSIRVWIKNVVLHWLAYDRFVWEHFFNFNSRVALSGLTCLFLCELCCFSSKIKPVTKTKANANVECLASKARIADCKVLQFKTPEVGDPNPSLGVIFCTHENYLVFNRLN